MKVKVIIMKKNLKIVIPVILITLVIIFVAIYFIACDGKNNTLKSSNVDKEETLDTETTDVPEEETTSNTVRDTHGGSLLDKFNKDSNDDTSETENKKVEKTTKNPNKNEISTTIINELIPDYEETKQPSTNLFVEEMYTGKELVDNCFKIYKTKETVTKDQYYTYYYTEGWKCLYYKYADGTEEYHKDVTIDEPYEMEKVSFYYYEQGDCICIDIYILGYETYEGTEESLKPKGPEAKKMYDKYFKKEYEELQITTNGNYTLRSSYYIDKKTNKTYATKMEIDNVLEDRYINNVTSQLGLNKETLSNEMRLYLVMSYYMGNDYGRLYLYAEDIAYMLKNRHGIPAYVTTYKNILDYNYTKLLVQMEDGLWYSAYFSDKCLFLQSYTREEFVNLPSNIVFATEATTNLVYKNYRESNEATYIIPFSAITY